MRLFNLPYLDFGQFLPVMHRVTVPFPEYRIGITLNLRIHSRKTVSRRATEGAQRGTEKKSLVFLIKLRVFFVWLCVIILEL